MALHNVTNKYKRYEIQQESERIRLSKYRDIQSIQTIQHHSYDGKDNANGDQLWKQKE